MFSRGPSGPRPSGGVLEAGSRGVVVTRSGTGRVLGSGPTGEGSQPRRQWCGQSRKIVPTGTLPHDAARGVHVPRDAPERSSTPRPRGGGRSAPPLRVATPQETAQGGSGVPGERSRGIDGHGAAMEERTRRRWPNPENVPSGDWILFPSCREHRTGSVAVVGGRSGHSPPPTMGRDEGRSTIKPGATRR